MDIKDTIKEVLSIEANELLRHIDLIGDEIKLAVSEILKIKGKLIVTGVGKSGHIGAKIAATLASTGTPSFFIHPTEALHGDLGMIQKNDLILAISYSGESEELIKICPHIKEIGVKIIAMAKSINSSLGKFSDIFIGIDVLKEACPLGIAPTTSTTLTLAIGDVLAVALMKARDFKEENFAFFHPGGSLGKRYFLKVSDIMKTKNLPILRDDVTLKDAINEMTHAKFGSVILVDNSGVIKAFLSDGDLRRALMSKNFDINAKAIEFATKNPKILKDSNMLASKATKLIKEYKIQVLLIADNLNRPIGILHIHDLINLGL